MDRLQDASEYAPSFDVERLTGELRRVNSQLRIVSEEMEKSRRMTEQLVANEIEKVRRTAAASAANSIEEGLESVE